MLLVASIGTYLLLGSHAATPYVSTTADSGTLTSGATKQTCSGASDGSCVVFRGSSSTPPTWYGTFASGSISSTLYPYQSYVPGSAVVTNDPMGSGQKVLHITINSTDTPYSGSAPRADFESPKMFFPGSDYYISVSVLVPSDNNLSNYHNGLGGFPGPGEVYGQPYGGAPTLGMGVYGPGDGTAHWDVGHNVNNNYSYLWVGPVIDHGWHNFIYHEHFATDNTGFAQMWFDGVPQQLSCGNTTCYYPTMVAGLNWDGTHGNFLDIQMYGSSGMPAGLTYDLYHGAPAVGTTLQSVESTLSSPQGP